MDSYFISGHGFEDFTVERSILPEGVTLILLAKCGMASLLSDVAKYAKYFKAPFNGDPKTLPDDLRDNLRIYKPGSEYPAMKISLSLEFFYPNHEVNFYKAGVYKNPIDFDFDTPIFEGTTLHGKYIPPRLFFDNTDDVIEKVYEDSILSPNIDKITKNYGKKEFSLQVLTKEIPITDIFNKLGPGIYYFLGCRSIPLPPLNFQNARKALNGTTNTHTIAEHILKTKDFLNDNLNLKQNLENKIRKSKAMRAKTPERRPIINLPPKEGGRRHTLRKKKSLKKRKLKNM